MGMGKGRKQSRYHKKKMCLILLFGDNGIPVSIQKLL